MFVQLVVPQKTKGNTYFSTMKIRTSYASERQLKCSGRQPKTHSENSAHSDINNDITKFKIQVLL